MDKLKMHSPDLGQDNIAKLRELFPDVVTEVRDEKTGELRLAVDFDQLRQEMSVDVVEGPQERFQLNWPGKRRSILAANSPIAKTLRPRRGVSVRFDETANLLIEGDNLDALKLLQGSFLGAVDLIYIDPPYNTGNDFIYNDRFSTEPGDYLHLSGQETEDGLMLSANTEANGRFHSDWLSMMYARLRLARSLLSPRGTIFVSVDGHEVHRLTSVCDEIFGESGHKNTIAVRRGIKNVQAQFEDLSALSQGHEYILLYARNGDTRLPKLMLSHGDRKPGKWDTFWRGTDRPTMRYELFGVTPATGQWRWEEGRTLEAAKNYEYYLKEKAGSLTLDEWFLDTLAATNVKLNFVRKNDDGTVQYYVPPSEGKLLSDNWMDLTLAGDETEEFDTEKSVGLLERIVSWTTGGKSDAIVMDFFAGSGTTAHAVMKQNSYDGGRRRFILVQLPEAIRGEGQIAPGQRTVVDVTRERLIKSGQEVLAAQGHPDWNGDVGFRVLKIDSSNMKDVYYRPDEVAQSSLLDMVDNVKEDRTAEDLLFQVLVDWGVDLSLPIRHETIVGKTVYFVDDDALVACFDTGVSEELVKSLAQREPLRVVFRDNGFASDATKINVEQIFRQLSPGTEVRSI